jgi:hypothetical protein
LAEKRDGKIRQANGNTLVFDCQHTYIPKKSLLLPVAKAGFYDYFVQQLILIRMKKIFAIVIFASLLTGCKKTIEAIQEDLVIKAMTDGQWSVTSFTLNGTNITPDFATYKFKYYSNKTVDAINSGSVEKTGTWDGNASTMTTSANFTTPVYPLILINGNWQITRNSWTYVEATQTSGSDTKTMRLDKQ